MTTTETEGQSGWGSGVTLKKVTTGYSWTISVAADGADHTAELRQAYETAMTIDGELRDAYHRNPWPVPS